MPESSLQTEWLGQFGRGLWRYIRPRFAFAGQDSFTDPPGQNEDKFELLLNTMPPVQGDLDRRWGYRAWNTSAPQGTAAKLAPYPTSLYTDSVTAARSVVVSTGVGQSIFSESGQLLYKLTYPGAPGVRSVTSNGALFSTDGVKPQRWTTALGNTTQNWGIDVNNVTGGPAGPNPPTVAADQGSSGVPGTQGPLNCGAGSTVASGGSVWVNPNNIATNGLTSTSSIAPEFGVSNFLTASNFGFTIPAGATITGVVVSVQKSGEPYIVDDTVALTVGSTDHSNNTSWFGTATYGSSSDTWGAALTPAVVNGATFGFSIAALNTDTTTFNDFGKVLHQSRNRTATVFGQPTITVYYTLPSGNSWTNPNNILLEDGAVATAVATSTPSSDLRATGFGFAISPSLTIAGIQFDFKCSTGAGAYILAPVLVKAGVSTGTRETTLVSSSSLGFVTLGSSFDLWGTSWSPADVNDPNFGVQFQVSTASGSAPASIDFVRATIWTTVPPITVGPPSGTGVTLVSGRLYTYAFYNSLDGPHYSNIGKFSVSTGPVTNQSIPLSTIPVCLDPQVDRKKILATADGGDEETLYEVGDILNVTTTFTDSMPEEVLLLANQWQSLLSDGTSTGLVDNTPPLATMDFPTLHRGRVYGLVGNNLVFSKSLDELFTATGVIAGRWEESFPGLNYFPVTATGEQGRGILSDGTVLYIGTDRRIIRLFGDGPNTFLQPQVLFDNVGILNQDVWKLVLIEGNPIGAMWLTPDYRVLGSDFNTYQDVGLPIQDVLNNINVAAINTAWAANVNISVFNLYVLAVPTGQNTQPDTVLVFDIKGRNWYTWRLSDTAVGGFWWVTIGGQPQFIIQAVNGKLYLFDPSLLQDRVGDTPISFEVTARTSWLNMGDGTAYKNLNEIEIGTLDLTNGMQITIEGASSIQDFASPRTVVLNANLVQKPRGTYGVFLAGASTRDRYYRLTFNFTDSQTDLLRSWNIQGRVLNRI